MKLPPLPHHPEPQIMRWTALEEAAIRKAQADAARAALEEAALWVRKRADDYDAEHGTTDPETGTREYPGNGDDYMMELAEIEAAIRAIEVKHD